MSVYHKALHVQTMQPWYIVKRWLGDPGLLCLQPGVHWEWAGWNASENGGIECFTDEEVTELFTFEEEAPPALRHLFEAMPTFREWRGLCRVSGLAS